MLNLNRAQLAGFLVAVAVVAFIAGRVSRATGATATQAIPSAPPVATVNPTIRAYLTQQLTATAIVKTDACAQVQAAYAHAGATPDPRKGISVMLLEILGFNNDGPNDHSPYVEYLRNYWGNLLGQCYG